MQTLPYELKHVNQVKKVKQVKPMKHMKQVKEVKQMNHMSQLNQVNQMKREVARSYKGPLPKSLDYQCYCVAVLRFVAI